MITKKGQQILIELKSEQLMDVEDKKWWFVFKDVGSIPHFLLKVSIEVLKAMVLYSVCLLVIFIAMLDEQNANWLLSKPLSELTELRDSILLVVVSLTTAYIGFFSFRYWSNIVSNKSQYQLENEQFYRDQQLQIELIEEVLARHNLIDRKE